MKIYENLIPKVAKEFIKKAINSNYFLIGKTKIRASEMDIESIFNAYLKQLKEINQIAKDRISKADDKTDPNFFNKVKKQVAAEQKFSLEKNNEIFLVKQLMGLIFQSENIEDIMVDDIKIEKLFLTVCKKHFISDEDLENEIKKRLAYFPDLKEGTKKYQDKYKEVKEKLEIAKGLRNIFTPTERKVS